MSDIHLENEQYKYVFDTLKNLSSDGFIVVNRNGYITDFNQAYADFMELKINEIVGRHITEIIPDTEMIRVMETRRTDKYALRAMKSPSITQNSKNHILIVSRAPVLDDKNNVICSIAQMKFHRQLTNEMALLDDLYSQLNSYKDEVYHSALKRLESVGNTGDKDKQYLLLQYYQDELRRLGPAADSNVIGNSTSFKLVKERALKVAKISFAVLITGETGTGKEVIADLIHNSSDRADAPFVKVNCAAIPSELLESELFGYVGGAFTGAQKKGKKGKFEIADGGSIFLDEIGDMPLKMQAKLLRVIQTGEVEPIGSTRTVKLDVRVISATRCDLPRMVQEGRFREDLYYRLNEVHIAMPRLIERISDIKPLAEHMLGQINKRYSTKVVFSEAVIQAFEYYHWPGNIRELNNVIKSAYSVVGDNKIELFNLPNHITEASSNDNKQLKESLDDYEKQLILNALARNDNNYVRAANKLGIHRSSLYNKMKKYGINRLSFGEHN